MRHFAYVLLIVVASVFFTNCNQKTDGDTRNEKVGIKPEFSNWAKSQPLGWNCYDDYHAAITEQQFLQGIDSLEKKILPCKYDTATIDFCCFNPSPDSWNPDQWTTFPVNQEKDSQGNLYPQLAMGNYGRLLPAENRFPSAKNANGFKAIGDYLHKKKMKFGIHIIRGIAHQKVHANTTIKGTEYYAQDIAKKVDTCKWNNNMYRVDPTKPGAQEYYNSLFDLYAEWGVDFVKVDDISAPTYHSKEIELIRNAIDQCGRPMVLSLSCGEVFVSYADHLAANANMYRISNAFWDHWHKIAHIFELAYAWWPHNDGGTWPDLDMIPIGNLYLTDYPNQEENGTKKEHFSRLTQDEKRNLMTLWSFAKSPVIYGGVPICSCPEDFTSIKNKELLNINQNSIQNRQAANFVYEGMGRTDGIWLAESTGGNEKYISFFILGEEPPDLDFYFYWENWDETYEATDLWSGEYLGIRTQKIDAKAIHRHGTIAYKMRKIV